MKKPIALDYIIMTYFKNVLINIPYSLLMFGVIALKLFAFENARFLLVIPSELITAFLCVCHILLILRVRFAEIIKLIPAVLIFSLLLIGADFLFSTLGVCEKLGVVSVLLLFSTQYFLFSGVFVMFFRHTLTERKERLFRVILRNLPSFFMMLIFSWSVFLSWFLIVSFSSITGPGNMVTFLSRSILLKHGNRGLFLLTSLLSSRFATFLFSLCICGCFRTENDISFLIV